MRGMVGGMRDGGCEEWWVGKPTDVGGGRKGSLRGACTGPGNNPTREVEGGRREAGGGRREVPAYRRWAPRLKCSRREASAPTARR